MTFFICKTHSVHFQGSGIILTQGILLTLELATVGQTCFHSFWPCCSAEITLSNFWRDIKCIYSLNLQACLGEMWGWFAPEVCVCTPLKTALAPRLIADKWVSWRSRGAWWAPRSRRALVVVHDFSLNHSAACLGGTSLYCAPWLAISHSRLCCLWQADMSGQADRWTGGEMEWFLWVTD